MINYNCVILDTSPVHIGENAFIAPGVCIACSGHSKDAAQRAAGIGTSAPVTIGRDVWTIIGAGSVVTKDIPSGVIAAGNPCRVFRKVTEEDRCRITGEERG